MPSSAIRRLRLRAGLAGVALVLAGCSSARAGTSTPTTAPQVVASSTRPAASSSTSAGSAPTSSTSSTTTSTSDAPTPTAAPIVTRNGKVTVLEIGDSLGIDLGWGMQWALQSYPNVTLLQAAKGDSGLANVGFYNWPAALQAALKATTPRSSSSSSGRTTSRASTPVAGTSPSAPPPGARPTPAGSAR